MATYTYSKATDFPGGKINPGKLKKEIADSSIATALTRIDTNSDVVDIIFDASLSAGDKTTLDNDTTGPAGGLIAAHDNADYVSDNLDSSGAPTSTDDSALGYDIGSCWVNTTTDKIYFCLDATEGAAVWSEDPITHSDIAESGGWINKTGVGTYEARKVNLNASVDPGVNDDQSTGYKEGARWLNTTTNKEFVCLDKSNGAAVWLETTAGGGGSLPVADTTAIVKGSTDATKLVRIEADGLTTGTTRVITMPDQDLTLIDTADSRLSDDRTAVAHTLGSAQHSSDTLANLNAKISDATLIDTGDSRLSDNRTDTSAIHDDVSAEISALTEKVTPVSGDHLLIEDSAASNAKKRVQIGNLPSGGDPTSDEATATGTITTTSTTYVLATSMTITPASGTYIVWADTAISHDVVNLKSWIALYSGGSVVSASVRAVTLKTASQESSLSTMATVTVNGSQAIELKWQTTTGCTASMYERTLTILKVS